MDVSLQPLVYTPKFSTGAPALMKHVEMIQDLAVKNHNLKFYYENFRYLRQGHPQLFPRGNIHWELWLWAQVNEPNDLVKPRCYYSNRGRVSCWSADGRNLRTGKGKCAALRICDAEVRNLRELYANWLLSAKWWTSQAVACPMSSGLKQRSTISDSRLGSSLSQSCPMGHRQTLR